MGKDARRILQHYARQREETLRRELLLDPNRDSPVHIERYTMAVFAANPDGTPFTIADSDTTITAISGHQAPDCTFRPQRLTTNSPGPGFISMSMAKVANVSFIVGGSIDAWQWNANARDAGLDIPTLTPANSASFAGLYLGHAFTNYVPSTTFPNFQFMMSASGPATITGLIEDAMVSEPT